MYDAAVIGGGLAGCHAAITLARMGRRVVMIEAGTYPRPKVCGEFLSPECATLFEQSGFMPRLRALHPTTISTVRLTAPDGSAWRAAFPASGIGISRYALDHALAQYAADLHVDVRDGMRVTAVRGDLSDGFTITSRTLREESTILARAVIGAHGKRSSLDKSLNRAFLRRASGYISLKTHMIGAPLPHHLDLHMFAGGYCGMSHVEDGTMNVCLLVRQDVFTAAMRGERPNIERFIAWMKTQNPALGAWLDGASLVYPDWLSIGQVTLRTKTILEGDMLMTGDAAAMIAPLAGDGMAMALHSGTMAADAINRFLDGVSADVIKRDYVREWRRAFAGRLRLGRALNAIMTRPLLIGGGLRVLNRLPALGDALIARTRDLGLVERLAQ